MESTNISNLWSTGGLNFDLLRRQVPGWDTLTTPEDIELKELYGLTNKIYWVKLRSPMEGYPTNLIYRVFGQMDAPLLNRQRENTVMQELGGMGLAPRVYYSDEATRLEEFLVGREANVEDRMTPQYSIQVAAMMALLNRLPSRGKAAEAVGVPLIQKVVEEGFLIDDVLSIQKFKDAAISKKTQEFMTNILTPMELRFLREALLDGRVLPQSAPDLCHNDIHPGNILYVTPKESFCLIDYEYSNYNPHGYDVANFLNEKMYTYGEEEYPHFTFDLNRFPKPEEILQFLMYYCYFFSTEGDVQDLMAEARSCKSFEEFQGILAAKGLLDQVRKSAEEMVGQIYALAMFANLFWILVFIIAYNSNEYKIGCSEYFDSRVQAYQFFKSKVLELKKLMPETDLPAASTMSIWWNYFFPGAYFGF